jgi:FMN phosphatase YigB (HAD superfamily)
MTVRARKLLILDLDNTLYDWVGYYASSFRAMLDSLEESSGIPRETLIADFKTVHQKYHSSEYSFSIQELPSLKKLHPESQPLEIIDLYQDAIDAFRGVRDRKLVLYPGVRETLRRLKKWGVRIAGHSDAMVYYAVRRLQRLDLIDYFDQLYAAGDHPVPDYLSILRPYSSDNLLVNLPVVRIPVERHKPDVELLKDILSDFAVQPADAVLVGDSLKRDVFMARQCGVFAVWARYGQTVSPEDFKLLVAITHWTEEDIRREQTSSGSVEPSQIIDRFPEIEKLFRL